MKTKGIVTTDFQSNILDVTQQYEDDRSPFLKI
jgi:hypothetical protein